MQIIYSGGWNNKLEESIKKSFLYTYEESIKQMIKKGNKVAFIALAKSDGHYDKLINSIYKNAEIIDSSTNEIEWNSYDGIFIPGGDSKRLKTLLVEKQFSFNKLKHSSIILGDSAGAYMFSTYFYKSPKGEKRGIEIEFLEGFNPTANVITIAHTNNPMYCNNTLIEKVEKFAKKRGLHVLKLAENEQKILVGNFEDVNQKVVFRN